MTTPLADTIRAKYSQKAAIHARRMAAAARKLAKIDAAMQLELGGAVEDAGHASIQFGWRSDAAGFRGIAEYGTRVAAAASNE